MKNLILLTLLLFFGMCRAQSISAKLPKYTWTAKAGSISAYMNFEALYDGATSGVLLVWTNFNACISSYTYDVSGVNVATKFLQNTCGAKASSNSFTYDAASNSISMVMNGNKQTYYAKTKFKP